MRCRGLGRFLQFELHPVEQPLGLDVLLFCVQLHVFVKALVRLPGDDQQACAAVPVLCRALFS